SPRSGGGWPRGARTGGSFVALIIGIAPTFTAERSTRNPFLRPLKTTPRFALLLVLSFGLLVAGLAALQRSFLRLRLTLHDRCGETRAGGLRQPLAELIAQDARRHLGDRAFGEFAQLKRTERDANEARDLQPEMAQHVAHLAIFSFSNRKGDPHVR